MNEAERFELSFDEKASDYLEHYGRKGMKWYQHIYGEVQPQAKYATKGTVKVEKTTAIERAKTAAKQQKKESDTTKKEEQKEKQAGQRKQPIDISKLSDAELDAILRRARMEREYAQLNPRKVSLGERLLKNVLAPVLEQQAKNYLNAQLGKVVKTLTSDDVKSAKQDEPKGKKK